MPLDRKASTFLDLIRRSERGRLKVYLGYAPGVGKTYAMLQEAHRLKQEKLDVVVGLVETHGRTDTARLVDELEVIPRRTVSYRGITLEEMDVDAILARAPQIALVDELAHTNPPDSKHPKRYMDIEDLLAAGIHVISTMNVQHLESLYNTVENLVQVRVSERVPDLVLKQADEIVNVDLSAEDLLKRLARGKIYAPASISQATQNYFQGPRLEHLRELTLREAASQIDIRRREQEEPDSRSTTDQIVVCLSSSGSNNANLLRYGSRLAGKLNRRWYAVHVQTPRDEPLKVDATKQRVLSDNLTLANQLGAMVFTLKGTDIADTILRFAHDYRIGHIVIGRPSASTMWRRILRGPSNVQKLIQRGDGFRIVVLDERLTESPKHLNSHATDTAPKSIYDCISSDNLLVWNQPCTKEQAIADLFHLVQTKYPEEIQKYVLNSVLAREQEMSTFLNEGIAIPHAVVPGLHQVRWAMGLPKMGISSITDAVRTDLVVLALYSPENSDKYLASVAKIVSELRDSRRIEALRSVTNDHELGMWVRTAKSSTRV